MGRMYSIEFEDVAVTVAQELFEFLPAINKPCYVHALFLSQYTDFKDAEEEILRIRVIRGHTTVSGGASVTPRPMDANSTAAGIIARRAIAGTPSPQFAADGTAVNLHSDAFNIRVGYQLILPPEMRWRVQNASLLVVRLIAAPTDSVSMAGTLYVEEV